jgi:hypothetical protein
MIKIRKGPLRRPNSKILKMDVFTRNIELNRKKERLFLFLDKIKNFGE